jgi:hypothetical protein
MCETQRKRYRKPVDAKPSLGYSVLTLAHTRARSNTDCIPAYANLHARSTCQAPTRSRLFQHAPAYTDYLFVSVALCAENSRLFLHGVCARLLMRTAGHRLLRRALSAEPLLAAAF